MAKRGAFIVLEGLDRSGKSTQVKNLVTGLKERGIKAVDCRFPDRTTTTGQMINSYLLSQSNLNDQSIHLLFSANRWERSEAILKDLKEGITVICDRYAYSGIAFSAIKGLPYVWCKSPDIGLPSPDLILFLDISPSAAASRGGYGEERYEKAEVQEKVRGMFGRIGEDVREGGGRWMKVDAGGSVDSVGREIMESVERVIEGLGEEEEVGRLWE